jgi:hypothetical protein
MSKNREKQMAIELRQQGYSYSEIMETFEDDGRKVSKGSLSNWLKNVELEPSVSNRLESRIEQKHNDAVTKARDVKKQLHNKENDKKNRLAKGGFFDCSI